MFDKKKCPRCNEKVSKNFEFCPSCGARIKNTDSDWGMLGRNDFANEPAPFEEISNSILGGLGGKVIDKMLHSAMKMMEKEFQKDARKMQSAPRTNMRLMINGKEIPLNQNPGKPVQKNKELPSVNFSSEKQKKFSNLPKEEPEIKIQRIGNRLTYQINMPGVKSLDDISILRLENSIEIKALAPKKAYKRILQISLPIINYSLEGKNLVLELEAK